MISRKRWSTWQHVFPRENLGWKTLYEFFYSHTAKLAGIIACPRPDRRHRINCSCLAGKVSSPSLEMSSRPSLSCSVMDEVRHHGQKKRRLRKLDPRTHIGYLVGYDSTNIFRVWIPHQGKVISTRDVLFDEDTFFDGRKTLK